MDFEVKTCGFPIRSRIELELMALYIITFENSLCYIKIKYLYYTHCFYIKSKLSVTLADTLSEVELLNDTTVDNPIDRSVLNNAEQAASLSLGKAK